MNLNVLSLYAEHAHATIAQALFERLRPFLFPHDASLANELPDKYYEDTLIGNADNMAQYQLIKSMGR